MKKVTEKVLKLAAKASEKAAVKSCCKTSGYDAYQPKMPEEVRKLRKS
ncbi:MAG: cyclic lactone autoinducer peptide [Clostridium sp.]|nr:cyclic lactone autoinducer peptide [Clostridium sp.]